MDDAARLVSELQSKLAELDGKVAAYQRDMLAQFHRRMHDCLSQYPAHVSNEVSRVIAASMSKYPALSPTRRDSGDQSPLSDDLDAAATDAERRAWDGRKSPPPILYHTSGIPKEGPRSPHQREKEFQGVFTPSYLPLLDGSYRTPQSPPVSPPAEVPTFTPSTETANKVQEPKESETVTDDEQKSGPVKRMADRSPSSSSESPGSNAKVRRSALRRSSSSNKGSSPRRVRFDFEGEEVFPTASPQASVTTLSLAGGAEEPQPLLEAAAAETTSAIAGDGESPSYSGGISLLDVEGEEDSFPRPRKVSSTQALQALSRSPLDAGTTWQMVNADPEDVPKMNGGKEVDGQPNIRISEQPLRPTLTKTRPEVVVRLDDTVADSPRIDELLGSPIEELEEYHDEDASDEEFLSMSTRLPRKTPSPVVVQMPFGRAPEAGALDCTAVSVTEIYQEEDEDPLFEFDDEGGRASEAQDEQPAKYLSDEDEDEEDEIPVSERLHQRLNAATAATAAAADENTPPVEPSDEGVAVAVQKPPVSPSAALFGSSVGSYMGRPLRITPINNQQLYDEIASMKDVPLLFGSIDDPENAASYRASVARSMVARNMVGTPRSFSERLALEEAMEARRAEREREREGQE